MSWMRSKSEPNSAFALSSLPHDEGWTAHDVIIEKPVVKIGLGKSDLVTIAYIPCACRMLSESEIILGEFGQRCHDRFVFDCVLVHKYSTAEHRAKVRVEHWLFV